MIPTSILIATVLIIMMITTCTVAFVHGWQDGDQPDPYRHAWLPKAAYLAGGRLRQARYDEARADLLQRRRDAEAFYAALDAAVRDELAQQAATRKDQL